MSLTSVPSRNNKIFVIDSWPILETILRGVVIPRMDVLIERAARLEVDLLMSEMNLGEIFYLVSKSRTKAEAEIALETIARLPIRIVGVVPGDVLAAARLKAATSSSYADCFCARLAMLHAADVVTGDRDFLAMQESGLLTVEWVGA